MIERSLTGLVPRYSVIIPAYNEEHRIGSTLRSYAQVFEDSEIIVVLNGCDDNTKDVVQRVRTEYANVHLVDIPDAVGKGGAVRAGFLLAQSDIMGYVDADGSTPAQEMRRLFESLPDDADAVIGSRWLDGSNVAIRQPLRRRLASRCFNVLVRLLFGLRFADTQCGAKVFRKAALQRVMRYVETANLAFDVDVLFQLSQVGLKVHEEPTHWVDSDGSRVKLVASSLRMLAALVRLRLHHSFMRMIVPLFDRCFPTAPVRFHDRLRILIMNWRDPEHPQAGGAEAYLFEQARRWLEAGHEVEWLTAGFRGCAPRAIIDGIPVRRIGNAASVYALLPLTYIKDYRARFDVIVDSENGIPFFSPLYCLKPKLCVVYHVHQDVFRKHLPFWLALPLMWCEAKLVPWLYRHSRFVTISDDTRVQMVRLGMNENTIGIVRCGVDSSLVPGKKSDVPTIVYLGRLKPYKRVDVLIDAVRDVRSRVPNVVLRIAGTGDARPALEELVARHQLQDAVIFEGFVDEDRKRTLLQEAWVSVSPSEMEGWGISVIESNACGTPAIAFSVPGLSEAIVDGQSGVIVPEGGDLSAAIVHMLLDTELRQRLERGAIARAHEFSWDKSAQAMLNEMMQVIVGGRIRSIDLDDDWMFLGCSTMLHGSRTYALSHRAMWPATPAAAARVTSATEMISQI